MSAQIILDTNEPIDADFATRTALRDAAVKREVAANVGGTDWAASNAQGCDAQRAANAAAGLDAASIAGLEPSADEVLAAIRKGQP